MGFLFKYKSVALYEDLMMKEINVTVSNAIENFYAEADQLFEEV